MLPDFKLYYKSIVIKAVWYWHLKARIKLTNGMELTAQK